VRALWTILVLLMGPLAGFIGGRRLRPVKSRSIIYISNAINLVVLAGITAAIDFTHGRRALDLIPGIWSPSIIPLWGISTAILCIALVAVALLLRTRLRRPPKPSIIALLPRGASEKIGFAFLCILIAAVEEFIYRGFALSTLRDWVGSDLLAVVLVCLSFALMHGLQDWIAILVAFVQGIVLAVSVVVVRSLLPAIAGHFAADLFAGSFLLPFLQRFRLIPNET
jgi:membrane protease YdiL (CAAX protease family)